VGERISFLHPSRDDFAATMTGEEGAVRAEHLARPRRVERDGVPLPAGPNPETTNVRVTLFEAPDEAAARPIMGGDPAVAGGDGSGELRPFRVSWWRGRNEA
jgi:uncharacterized protein YciI